MTSATQGHRSPLRPRIAVTMGDAAGIGPEVIVKAWQTHPELFENAFVVGDVAVMRQAASLWARATQVLTMPPTMGQHHTRSKEQIQLPVMPAVQLPQPIRAGTISAACGAAAAQCVQLAAQMALRHEVDALVTAPLNKEAMHLSGLEWAGHTEILAHEAGQAQGLSMPVPVRMMLMNPELKVVLHSIHVPLQEAIRALTSASLLETITIAHASGLEGPFSRNALNSLCAKSPLCWRSIVR